MKFNCLLFWIVFNIGQKHWCWKLAFVLVQRERVQLNLSLVYFGWQWIVILYIFLLQPSVLSIFVWGMCWPKWISIRLCQGSAAKQKCNVPCFFNWFWQFRNWFVRKTFFCCSTIQHLQNVVLTAWEKRLLYFSSLTLTLMCVRMH